MLSPSADVRGERSREESREEFKATGIAPTETTPTENALSLKEAIARNASEHL